VSEASSFDSTIPFNAMADSDQSPSGNAAQGSSGAEEKYDWPVRSRFQKKYLPYGVRICDETLNEIRVFKDCKVVTAAENGRKAVVIETREGKLRARYGDWIMEDSEGSHYPIAHEELRKTYEPVDDDRLRAPNQSSTSETNRQVDMPTKEDASRFSGEVAERLSDHHEEIDVIAPSNEFQGTRQGFWTVRLSSFEIRSELEFAVWPCRKEDRYHLGVRLFGQGIQVCPNGLFGHSRQLNSLHTSPGTAYHRLMGLLNAQAIALGAEAEAPDSSDQGADAVSEDWIT
jgi:hypothetical protein